MSTASFQDRLQRIGATPPQQNTVYQETPRAGKSERLKPKINYGFVVVGILISNAGVQLIKYTFQNYETIRDDNGIGLVVGLGLGGILLLVAGYICLSRAMRKKQAVAGGDAKPLRQASSRTLTLWSLLGFAFGAITILYMFVAGAAHYYDTETADTIVLGSIGIAFTLFFISLLIGFIGLFVPRYGLWRVPAYFVVGGGLIFVLFKFTSLNMLNSQTFLDYVK